MTYEGKLMTISSPNPAPSDPTALLAEWTAAMEGVPDGEIERAFIVDGYGEAIQGEAVLYLPDDNEAEFRGAHAEVISAWFERCSPDGIAPLLALIAQQAATIEAVTKERDEAREATAFADENRTFQIERAEKAEREWDAALKNARFWEERHYAEQDVISAAIGSVRFMDPPDGGDVSLSKQVRRMREALTAAEAERDRAREALEPFAKVPRDGAHSGAKYNHSTVFAVDGHELTVGDFRRARAALSTAKERGDG